MAMRDLRGGARALVEHACGQTPLDESPIDLAGRSEHHPPMRLRVTSSLTALACALAAVASAGKLISSWHDPAAGTLNFQKVLILVIAPHESQRQFGEVELSRLMKRTTGVPSYTVMTPADVESKETVLAFMARERFDGAVVMKFIGAAQ